MNKNNLVEIYAADSEINGDGDLRYCSEDLIKLRNKGFKNVKMVLYFDPLSDDNTIIDKELFLNIKSKQRLPDEVIIEFLESKGSLVGKNFKK